MKLKIETLEDKIMYTTHIIPGFFVLIKAPHPRAAGEIHFDADPEAIEAVKEAYEEYRRKKREKDKK